MTGWVYLVFFFFCLFDKTFFIPVFSTQAQSLKFRDKRFDSQKWVICSVSLHSSTENLAICDVVQCVFIKKKGKKHDHRPKHQTWSLFLSLSERSSVEALDLCLPWDLFVLAAVVSEETFSHSPARQRAALWLLFTHHYKGLTPSLCALSRSSAASPQCLDPCCSLDWRVDITAYKDWTFVYFLPPFGCFFPLFIHLHLDTSDSLRHWICAHRMMTTPFLPVEVK